MINITTTATNIQTIIENALSSITIYWTAATVPTTNLPNEFVIIEPLFANVNQSWLQNTHAQHTIQIRAAAKTIGRAIEIASTIQAALPADTYATPTAGPLVKVDKHYDMILTARTHASR